MQLSKKKSSQMEEQPSTLIFKYVMQRIMQQIIPIDIFE